MDKSKLFKSVTVVGLSLSLLFSTISYSPEKVSGETLGKTTSSSMEILNNLTDAQRKAMKYLELNDKTGLQLPPAVNLDNDEEISVILEFHQKPAKVAQLIASLKGEEVSESKAKSNINLEQKKFKEELSGIFKDSGKSDSYSIKYQYSEIFNGMAITLPANKIKTVLQTGTVKTIWGNETISINPPDLSEVSNLGITTKMADSNPHLGIDRLHEEGLTGKGIKIGVIDTGIDYNHPDLRDAYKGGYDFVDNDDDPMETTYENWKSTYKPEFSGGNSYYTNHGTHVSGIIAGQASNNSDYATNGVAPDADLYAYRVLGPYGSGATENVLKGIDQAVEDGMDIINLSLGAAINDPYYPTSVAVNNAVLSGVTAIVAAGNSGDAAYTLGSPGSSALALTVGASDTPLEILTYEGKLSSQSISLQLLGKHYSDKAEDFKGQTLPITEVGLGRSEDYSGKDVKDKIVLVRRGEISLNDKIKHAKLNEAKAIFMYNNEEDGHIPYFLGENKDFIPTFSLTKKDGEILLEEMELSEEFLFEKTGTVLTEGDRLADFSSRGPSKFNYDIKPEVVAPGVGIQSTVPSYMVNPENVDNYEYAYQRLSGTSMAAPQVAGIAALLLESNQEMQPEDIKTILMNTADPLNGDYSVFEVGAGRVDPYEAVHSNMLFQVIDETTNISDGDSIIIDEKTGSISFGLQYNDGKHIRDQRTIEVSNHGNEKKSFKGKVEFTNHSLGADENGVQVLFDKKVSIKPRKSKKTNAFVMIPKTAEPGFYEGYISYENVNDSNETFQVPFSIRVAAEGFDFLALDKQVLTTNPGGSYFGSFPVATFSFQLNSNVEQVDVVLADGKTGEDIGYVGYFNGSDLQIGIPYGLYGYGGNYYPFTGDEDYPVHLKEMFAKQGHYKLKFIATNESGKTFTEVDDIFVDNNKPEFNTSIDDQLVYEFSEGQETYSVSGTLIDNEVRDIQAAGINISQADNFIYEYLYTMLPDYRIFPEEDGTFEMEVPLVRPTNNIASLDALDAATNKTVKRTYNFVPEGTSYMTGVYSKKSAKPGDIVTFTMTANNVRQLKEAKFTLYFMDSMEILDIKENDALSNYDVDLQTNLSIGSTSNAKVDLILTGDQEITGDMPLLDVTFKVTDKRWTDFAGFNFTSNRYIDTNGDSITAQGYIEGLKLLNQTGIISGGFVGQGFLKPDTSVDFSRDYTKVGASIELISPDGTKSTTDINTRAGFSFHNIPINAEPYTLKVNIPGHFPYFKDIMVNKEEDGEITGSLTSITAFTYAGDVNQDDVIDIFDALYLKEKWQASDRSADINLDGIVDEKDWSYVEENYLMRNHTLDELKDVVKVHQGMTLEKVKKELGITNP